MAKRGADGPERDARLAERLAERKNASRFVSATVDVAALVDELELHQIELEMQNEDLLAARAESDAALALYAELYDFAPIGYFTLGSQGTIVQVNVLGAQLLGVDRAKLVDRRLGAFVASSSLPDFNAALSEARAGGQRQSCEVALLAAHEDERDARWVQLTFSAAAPNTVRAVAVDVTERRRLAEQLRTSQKMEAIGRLAGGVAHDFNNLLTVIIAGAENAQMAAAEGTPVEEDLQLVIDSAQRAAGLTRKLLAFGRRQLLRPQVVDVNLLLGDLAKLLRTLLGERSRLVMQLEPDLRSIEIDPIQLEQVIVNLVVNARDAMPDGGTLTITTGDAEVARDAAPPPAPGSYMVISVSDTGVGMTPELMTHIFEPFFTTKAREHGTGLGLASVAGIVEQSGGTILVRSKPGTGTTFDVYLRRTPGASAIAPSAKATPVARGGTETILVVDDEEPLRFVAERVLEAAGYTVLVAGSGAEALERLAQHAGPVHLLLSDVIMPGMTGPELADRVRAASPETKVLFMSGYADDVLGRAGVVAMETGFVAKPYSVQGLRAKVREALD